jgi:hypothetical protein
VDPWATVGPGHALGSLPIACSAAPALGNAFSVTFPSLRGAAAVLLAPGDCRQPPASVAAPFLCALLLLYPDPAGVWTVPVSGSPALLVLAVPPLAVLADQPLCLQGFVLDPASCVRASDGVALRIQKP